MRRLLIALALIIALTPVSETVPLVMTSLAGACDTTGNTAFTTASVSPTAGATIYATVVITSVASRSVSTITGAGLTWALETGSSLTSTVTHIATWRGVGTPSAGALTITASAVTTGMCWKIYQFTGIVNPASSVRQIQYGFDAASPYDSDPLAAFARSNNWTVWAVALADTAGTYTPKANYVEVGGARVTMATPTMMLSVTYLNGSDLTPNSTDTANAASLGVSMEIGDVAPKKITMLGVGDKQ